MAPKQIVFSGIQPTGEIHLGNYLGAIQWWRERLDERDSIFCVVDLHAITVTQDPAELVAATRRTVAVLIACGLSPAKCLIYAQSQVVAHAELGWILTCTTPVGWLLRMPQYHDKGKHQASVGSGLLLYPVLQAADILLFNADFVPTGEDQKAHVELARDIAGRFNNQYGQFFKLPESEVPEVGARIMGIDDPLNKMSKSSLATTPHHGIGLLDSPEKILSTFRRAVTDTAGVIEFSDDEGRAGVNNLLTIYQACTRKTREQVLGDFARARGYGDLKTKVAEVVIETLRPIREAYDELTHDQGLMDRVMREGAEAAIARCGDTIRDVRKRVGIIGPPTSASR